MSKIISIVGIALIAAAGVLTALSTSKEDLLKANKTLCAKYTKDAETALQSKDFSKALKFAKLAIKVDPDNKSGYKILAKITDAKCQGNAPATNSAPAKTETNNKASSSTQPGKAVQPAKAAQPAKSTQPAKPAPAEEEEMGC